LIVKLMVIHPYGLMHGGLLGMEEWEDRYREVVKELKTEKVTPYLEMREKRG
jgi:condensin complex subunit 1